MISIFLILASACLLIFLGNDGLSAMPGWSFIRCILGFFLGVLAYQVHDHCRAQTARWSGRIVLVPFVILAVLLSFKENVNLDYFVLPIFTVLTIAIAVEPEEGGISKILNCTPLRWLGKVSYSIYMAHLLVLMFMSRLFSFAQNFFNPDIRNWLGLVFVFLAVAVVLIVSQFTYQWIEKPYQNEFRDLAAKRFKTWKPRA